MSSSRSTDFSRLADRVRTVSPRLCACGERVEYEAPSGELVCLDCAPTALAGDETWGDLRVLDSDERWVEACDADA